MKRLISFLGFTALLITALPVFAAAEAQTEHIEVHGVEVPVVNRDRISELALTEQIMIQIREQLRAESKKGLQPIEINLTGIKNQTGFTLRFSPDFPFTIELLRDVRLFISPQAVAAIQDNSNGNEVLLEAAYRMDETNQVKAIDLRLTKASGEEIGIRAVLSLPAKGYGLHPERFTLEQNGEAIVHSCVQDGIFYSMVKLCGSYAVTEATPLDFQDESPFWAESAVDWLSTRGVVEGSGGLFRGGRCNYPRRVSHHVCETLSRETER